MQAPASFGVHEMPIGREMFICEINMDSLLNPATTISGLIVNAIKFSGEVRIWEQIHSDSYHAGVVWDAWSPPTCMLFFKHALSEICFDDFLYLGLTATEQTRRWVQKRLQTLAPWDTTIAICVYTTTPIIREQMWELNKIWPDLKHATTMLINMTKFNFERKHQMPSTLQSDPEIKLAIKHLSLKDIQTLWNQTC